MEQAIETIGRRARDLVFTQRYLVGRGIDIGPEKCLLRQQGHLFPAATEILWWNMSLGGESHMQGQADMSFDFVHASLSLAMQDDPRRALWRWLDLLKPGGHLILTVPCTERAESAASVNAESARVKWNFVIGESGGAAKQTIDVLELVRAVARVAQCERLAMVRHGSEPSASAAAIELVLRKRAIPSMAECMSAIGKARSGPACIAASDAAIETYPYRIEVLHCAMVELTEWRELDHLDALLERGVERMPGEHIMRLFQALHVIARGRLNRGFALREQLAAFSNWQRRTKAQPPTDTPRWNGEPLAGKSIVIWSEFGLGDEIFFFRFARMLRERAGARSVSVVCQTPLVSMFERSKEADAIIDVKETGALQAHDFWVYPHAIPAHFPLDLEALPPSVPYLRAPDAPAPGMSDLDPRSVKVGIVFKGDPTHENDKARSLPSLAVLDDLFAVEGVEFFSLQKGAGAEEAAEYARRLGAFHDIGAQVTSMDQTASAIAALDVVVTVDTSVAHLAGAMGKTVWLMLPPFGDWRWHYVREDSPWYPTMHLLRQRRDEGWQAVVARIASWLREWSADRGAGIR